MLIQFIEQQQCLTDLWFGSNHLGDGLTVQLMAALNSTRSRDTLKKVVMGCGTCDFRETKSCELLANFVANAQALKELWIQNSNNKVQIEADWAASAGQSGVIRVTRGRTVICECPTQKTQDRAVKIVR